MIASTKQTFVVGTKIKMSSYATNRVIELIWVLTIQCSHIMISSPQNLACLYSQLVNPNTSRSWDCGVGILSQILCEVVGIFIILF